MRGLAQAMLGTLTTKIVRNFFVVLLMCMRIVQPFVCAGSRHRRGPTRSTTNCRRPAPFDMEIGTMLALVTATLQVGLPSLAMAREAFLAQIRADGAVG